MTAPPELRELDEKIAEVRRNKEAAIDDQDFEKAASLRDEESKLSDERKAKEEAWKGGESDEIAEVGDQEIAEVLAMSTGIPVVRLTQTETAKLLKMEDELHKRVIGQDEAVKALAQSIRRTRSGLKDPNRPGGSFIFAGPTGVGKTELAKALAEFLFGDEDALISWICPSSRRSTRPRASLVLLPATSATTRAVSSRRRSAASRSRSSSSTRSRRLTRTSSTRCSRSSKRAA